MGFSWHARACGGGGLRVPDLASGRGLENFHVTREQVQTVLDFAAKSARPPLETLRAG